MPSPPDTQTPSEPDSFAFADTYRASGRQRVSRHPWIVWLIASLAVGAAFAYLVVPTSDTGGRDQKSWSGVIRILPTPPTSETGTGAPVGGVVLSDSAVNPSADAGVVSSQQAGDHTKVTTEVAPAQAGAPSAAIGDVPLPKEPAGNTDIAGTSEAPTEERERATKLVNAPRARPTDIATAQRLLADTGFDIGPADGLFGPRTRAAILAWQRRQGIPANSTVNAALIDSLRRAASGPVSAATVPVVTAPAASTRSKVRASSEPKTQVDKSPSASAKSPPGSRPIAQSFDPALNRFRAYERPVFERWCARGRLEADRLGYLSCIVSQTAEFPNGSGLPDLDVRPADERRRLLTAATERCDRGSIEPQRYFKCLADMIEAIDKRSRSTPRPTLN